MNQVDTTTHIIEIAANICTANSSVRFPCYFSVNWRTNDKKESVDTDKYLVNFGKAEINEIIKIRTEISFDLSQGIYLKKQTQLQLNLLSKNKPQPSKMVGRVNIDLANILNQNSYRIPTEIPLQFCSVNAVILVCFQVLNDKQETKVEKERHPRGSFKLNQKDSSLFVQESDSINILLRGQSALSNNHNNKLSEILHIKKEDSDAHHTGFKAPVPHKPKIQSILNVQKPIVNNTQNQQFPSGNSTLNNNESKLKEKQQFEDKMKEKENSHRLQLQSTFKIYQNIKIELEHQLELKQSTNKQMFTNIESLQGEVAHLRGELDKKMNENATLTLNLAETKQKHSKINIQLNTAEGQFKRLEGIVEQFKAVEGSKGELNSKLTQMKTELIQMVSKKIKLQSQNQQLKIQINNLNTEKVEGINIFEAKQKQMRQSLVEMTKQNTLLKNDYKNKETAIQDLQRLKSQLEEKVATFSSIAEEQQLKMSESEAGVGNMQQKICEHLNRIGQLEETLIQLDLAQKNSQIQNKKVSQLCDEYSNLLHQKVKENQQSAIKIKQTAQQFKNEKARLNSTIDELNTKISQLNSRIGILESQVTYLQQQLQKASQQILAKETLIIQLDSSLNTVVLQNNNLQQNIQQSMAQKEQTIHNIQTEIKEYQTKVNQLEELLIINSENTASHINNLMKSITDKENMINSKELELENFQLLLEATTQKLKQCSQELSIRQSLINRLQEGLNGQIQRSQELNKCIMAHLQKEQNLKANIIYLQKNMDDINELLYRQQQFDNEKGHVLIEKEALIQSLNDQLNQQRDIIFQYRNTLQESKIQFEAFQGDREEENLRREYQIRDKQNKLRQTLDQLNQKQNLIVELDQTINHHLAQVQSQKKVIQSYQLQLNNISSENHERQLQFQNNLKVLEQKLQMLVGEIQEVRHQSESKQLKISNLEDVLLEKQQQLCNKNLQLSNLRQQLKLAQFNITSIQDEHFTVIKEAQQKYLSIEDRCQEIQIQMEHKDNMHNDKIEKIKKQLSQLKLEYQNLCQQKSTYDMKEERQIQKKLHEEISTLKQNILIIEKEVAKIQGLQRSLKIKTIELNSSKFKGKVQGFDQNSTSQLLRLKDEQITELRLEIENLSIKLQKISEFQQKAGVLQVQLQLLQQQKFNIEVISNEKQLALVEVKQENRKLMDEITIIGQRNGQLEKMMVELLSKEKSGQGAESAANDLLRSLVKQNTSLKQQLIELDSTCKRLHDELQNKDERHMVDIIDQQLKLSITEKSNTELRRSFQLSQQNSCQQLPNGQNIYGQLKRILGERNGGLDNRILQIAQLNLSQSPQFQPFYAKIKSLSKQISKIKVQILKSGEKIGQRQKYLLAFKQVESFIEQLSLFPSQ